MSLLEAKKLEKKKFPSSEDSENKMHIFFRFQYSFGWVYVASLSETAVFPVRRWRATRLNGSRTARWASPRTEGF
jgi:hypothetical protein